MNRYMNRRVKIAIVVSLVMVALITLFWATTSIRLYSLKRLEWGRWNLDYNQKTEIEQLIKDLREKGFNWEEIKAVVETRVNKWGVKPIPGDIELFYIVKTVVTTINATLAVCLLIIYMDIYGKTRSEFTIGLIIFSTVLLFYSLTSNPLVHKIFGFHAFGLGPFAMLPDIFTCIALSILLYLSVKY